MLPVLGVFVFAGVFWGVAVSGFGTGAVTSVSFYDGATLLGSDSTSPYSFIWSNAPVGAHALTAVAAREIAMNRHASQNVGIWLNRM